MGNKGKDVCLISLACFDACSFLLREEMEVHWPSQWEFYYKAYVLCSISLRGYNVISNTVTAGRALGNTAKNWRYIRNDIEIFLSKLH